MRFVWAVVCMTLATVVSVHAVIEPWGSAGSNHAMSPIGESSSSWLMTSRSPQHGHGRSLLATPFFESAFGIAVIVAICLGVLAGIAYGVFKNVYANKRRNKVHPEGGGGKGGGKTVGKKGTEKETPASDESPV